MMPTTPYEGQYFKIDGKDMPIPCTIGIADETIWSTNTGRVSSGEMTGDIVGYKKKLSIGYDYLTKEEMKTLKSALKPAFFDVYFLDDEDNTFKTITCYRGEITSSVYGYAFDHTYKEISVNLIEK